MEAAPGAVYDAFISYRRSDGTRSARRLRQVLKSYRLPKKLHADRAKKLTVFLDTVYERGASDFYEKTIYPALMASRFLIVVATPDAVQRPEGEDWIAREVADFSGGPNADNVIVVRALGEFMDTLPADIAERHPNVQIVDMRDDGWLSRLLPQRAARLADEKLKIVGPLFGVALEDMPQLRREEERQQMGRLGTLTGAAVAIAVTVAGLSLYALQSQWQGQQALLQSFRVMQDSIYAIVEQYDTEEPLPSPARELVLQSCDVVARLTALSGAEAQAETKLACAIEENLAVGLAGKRGDASALIENDLADGEKAYEADPLSNDRLLLVLRAGFDSWASFEQATPSGRLDEVQSRLAAFERKLAERLGRDSTSPLPGELPLSSLTAYRRAAAAASAAGERHVNDKNSTLAVDLYAAARADARNSLTLLAAARDGEAYDAAALAWWLELAWTHYNASVGYAFAVARSDIAASRRAMDEAAALFRTSPGGDAQAAAAHAMLADLAMRYSQLENLFGEKDRTNTHRWECFEQANLALGTDNADGGGEADAGGQQSADRDRAENALSNCLDDMAAAVDARRAEVGELTRAGDLTKALPVLRGIIDDSIRMEKFRRNRSPWDHLYHFVALADLAELYAKLNRSDEAEAARVEAMRIYRPYIADVYLPDLTGLQVSIAQGAWNRIVTPHHAFLDTLRNGASTKAGTEAAALLDRLLASDGEWDAAMPGGPTAWDDVYQAEVRIQLAGLHRVTGSVEAEYEAMAAAHRLLAKYGGTFPLTDDSLARAEAAWKILSAWKATSDDGAVAADRPEGQTRQ